MRKLLALKIDKILKKTRRKGTLRFIATTKAQPNSWGPAETNGFVPTYAALEPPALAPVEIRMLLAPGVRAGVLQGPC